MGDFVLSITLADKEVSGFRDQARALYVDIEFLSRAFMDTLRQAADEEIYDVVESLCQASFGKYQGRNDPHRISALIREQSHEHLLLIIKAFTCLELLTNLAEKLYQEQRRQTHIDEGKPALPNTLTASWVYLQQAGLTPDVVHEKFSTASISPVFSAALFPDMFPDAVPIMHKIFALMNNRATCALDSSIQALNADITQLIGQLWTSDLAPLHRKTLQDALSEEMYYYKASLLEVIPQLHQEIHSQLVEIYPESTKFTFDPIICCASNIGGDGDSYPDLTHTDIENSTHQAAYTAYCYYRELLVRAQAELGNHLKTLDPIATVIARLDAWAHAVQLPQVYISQVKPSVQTHAEAYRNPAEFIADLQSIHDNFPNHETIETLIAAVMTFGFHLRNLNITYSAQIHEKVVAELLDNATIHSHYLELSEPEREKLLRTLLHSPKNHSLKNLRRNTANYSETVTRYLALIDEIAQAHKKYGRQAIPRYVLADAGEVSDILEVLLLLKEAGIYRIDPQSGQPVADMSVTIGAKTLQQYNNLAGVIRDIFDIPEYGALVAGSLRQEILLNYTELGQEIGAFAAHWALYRTQLDIAQSVSQSFQGKKISLTIFHGKGNPVGRRGWPSYEAILAAPQEVMRESVCFVEQGENIYAKYGYPQVAYRNAEILLTGVLQAAFIPAAQLEDPSGAYRDVQELADLAQGIYQRFVYEKPEMSEYFSQATPSAEMGLCATVSGAAQWALGWTQCRGQLSGWYGVGAAIEEWLRNDPVKQKRLQDYYRQWPFFKVMISNISHIMVKTDTDLLYEYSALVTNQRSRSVISSFFKPEYYRTKHMILGITGRGDLTYDNLALKRTTYTRYPYLEPIHHVHIELLRRYRNGDRDPTISQGLCCAMKTIATALRNTC